MFLEQIMHEGRFLTGGTWLSSWMTFYSGKKLHLLSNKDIVAHRLITLGQVSFK